MPRLKIDNPLIFIRILVKVELNIIDFIHDLSKLNFHFLDGINIPVTIN